MSDREEMLHIDNEITTILNKIRAEIEQLSSELTSDGRRMIRRGNVFRIIDKYKAESDHKCYTCKHYTSGEHDGSCGSYICKGYSNWESEDEE